MPGGNSISKTNIMKYKFFLIGLFAVIISSCKKYDGYIKDFDYSMVYFAYQNPVRTVFADSLKLKVGVVLGGKRENNTDEKVSFRIAPELLTDPAIVGTNNFTLLPSNYYTLSNQNEITIPKGEFSGAVTVNLNSQFLADNSSTQNTYAIPLLITSSSTDSILIGSSTQGIPRKDYSVIVIKYINTHHGVYYHRGVRKQYDASGQLVNTLSYASNAPQEYVQNIVWNVFTVNTQSLKTNGIGEFTSSGNNNYALILTHSNADQVSISSAPDSDIANVVDNGNSYYDKAKKSYYLNYQYTNSQNLKNVMTDTLIFRDNTLKLELW